MAKSKSSGKASGNSIRSANTRWVNFQLDDNDKAAIVERATDLGSIGHDLIALAQARVDVFVKFREQTQDFSCVAIFPGEADNGDNVGVSGFAPDVSTACAALLYKVFELASGEPGKHASPARGNIG